MILLSSSLNSFIQLLGVLLIFLFVLVITYFTTKWIGGYQKVQMSGRSFQVVDTIRIANNKLVQVIKMGDVYLVIAVAKDNVTMLAKLTEEEMGLTEAEICNGKTPGQNGEKGQMTFQETRPEKTGLNYDKIKIKEIILYYVVCLCGGSADHRIDVVHGTDQSLCGRYIFRYDYWLEQYR